MGTIQLPKELTTGGRPTINGVPVSNDQFNRYWTDVFRADPEMQRIFSEVNAPGFRGPRGTGFGPFGGGEKAKEQAATERALALGWRPPNNDWSVDFDDDGFRSERANAFSRNADWIVPLAVGGATLGFGLAGSGPLGMLGGGGGSAAAGTGAAAATGAGTAGTTAAGTGALAAAGTGAATTGLLPRLIDIGSTAAAGALAGREAGQAAAADSNRADYATQLAGNRAQLDRIGYDLEQRKYLDNRFQQKTNEAARGSLMTGLEDVEIDAPEGVVMGNVRGGLRPSAMPHRKEIGEQLRRQAMLELMNPTQPGGIADASGSVPGQLPGGPRLPTIPHLPSFTPADTGGGGIDTGLGIAALAGPGLSFAADLLRNRSPRPAPPRLTPSGPVAPPDLHRPSY